MEILGSEGVELPCGRSLVRERTSKGVSITPEELERATKSESLPMHWLGDSGGQKRRDGRFPMVGKGKEKGETIGYLAK
jgi:hypothetical protein